MATPLSQPTGQQEKPSFIVRGLEWLRGKKFEQLDKEIIEDLIRQTKGEGLAMAVDKATEALGPLASVAKLLLLPVKLKMMYGKAKEAAIAKLRHLKTHGLLGGIKGRGYVVTNSDRPVIDELLGEAPASPATETAADAAIAEQAKALEATIDVLEQLEAQADAMGEAIAAEQQGGTLTPERATAVLSDFELSKGELIAELSAKATSIDAPKIPELVRSSAAGVHAILQPAAAGAEAPSDKERQRVSEDPLTRYKERHIDWKPNDNSSDIAQCEENLMFLERGGDYWPANDAHFHHALFSIGKAMRNIPQESPLGQRIRQFLAVRLPTFADEYAGMDWYHPAGSTYIPSCLRIAATIDAVVTEGVDEQTATILAAAKAKIIRAAAEGIFLYASYFEKKASDGDLEMWQFEANRHNMMEWLSLIEASGVPTDGRSRLREVYAKRGLRYDDL